MTYLELVNGVLARLRQDEIATVVAIDDESAKLVASFVNDAKVKCENAWQWNCLRTDWELTMVPDQEEYALTDSGTYVIIDNVSNDTFGYFLDQTTPQHLKFKKFGSGPAGKSKYFTVSGANSSKDVTIEVWPRPSSADTVTVTGFKNQATLALDADEMLIPYLPVLYEALALAARERGEVGGQTALEIFGMANKYLQDAIALDATLSPLDNIWFQS